MDIAALLQQPNSGAYTPETLDRRRRMAEAMLGQSMGVQQIESPWQGLAQMLQAGIGGYQANRADEEEAAKREEANARIAQMLSGGMETPMGDLTAAAGDPWASDANQQLAMMLLGEQVKKQNTPAPGPDFGFIELPDGRIVRTDATSGTVSDLGQFGATAAPEPGFTVLSSDEVTGLGLPPGSYQRGPDQRIYPLGEGGGSSNGLTDTQVNLQWRAEQAGLQPGTPEYQQFMMTGGQGGTSLSVGPDGAINFSSGAGGKFGQTVDTAFGGTYSDIQNAGLSAITGIDTLDAMEAAMADPSFYSGFGADQLLGAKRFAAALGIDPDGVTSMEAFNGLSKQSALAAMGGSLGAGFSNADRSFVEQQVPSLANTAEGNVALAQIQRKLLERKIEIADLAERYVAAHGKLDGGFTGMLAQWSEANPLFTANGDQAPGTAAGGAVAVNPQTGERIRWNGSEWEPM